MQNKIIRKGFTLLEILITLTILTLISLITIGIVNPDKQFAKGRNLERMSEMKTIYTALERYNLVNSKYPDNILNMGYGASNVREICATGKLEEGEPLGGIDCTDKLDLRILVPKFITEIPRDSKGEDSIDTGGTGYVIYGTGYMAIKKNDNNVGLYAKVPENGAYLAIGVTEVDLSEPPAQTVPDQITNLNGLVSNGSIDLTWGTPFDGNSPITGYRVEYSTDNFATQTDINLGVTNQTQISGITVAGEYKVRVYAINALGNGGISNLVTANFGVPSSIENLIVNGSSGNMVLNWTEPNLNGGSLNSYKIRYSDNNFSTYTEISLGNVLNHNFTITNNGVYKFKVLAENQYGIGEDPINLVSGVACNVTCANNNGANVIISTNTTYTTDQINIGTLTVNAGITLTTSKKIDANITNINGTLTSTLGTSIDLKTNDLNIASGGKIDVSGKGNRGGWKDGNPSTTGEGLGGGQGGFSNTNNGAGHGGYGGRAVSLNAPGTSYGNIENPNDLGSGGGGYSGSAGGNGGGLVKVVVNNNLSLIGDILANGMNQTGSYGGGGSGGSINLTVGQVFSGNGTISVNGGTGGGTSGGGGSGGRIAIKYGSKTHTGNISSNGETGFRIGAAGTIWQMDMSNNNKYLAIDNNNKGANPAKTDINSSYIGTDTLENLSIVDLANVEINREMTINNTTFELPSGVTFTQNSVLNIINNANINVYNTWTNNSSLIANNGSLTIYNGGLMTHSSNVNTKVNFMQLDLKDLTINTGGLIDVSGQGYQGGYSGGNTSFSGYISGQGGGGSDGTFRNNNGAGYGGNGGRSSGLNSPGLVYGNSQNPNDLGSGGGGMTASNNGGNGGGLVRINVNNNLTLSGGILSNGLLGGVSGSYGGGGSGGSIYINVVGNINLVSGSQIFARGGLGDFYSGGGGGGRIAILYGSQSGTGSISVSGGGAGTGSTLGVVAQPGSSGTVYQLQQ